jgi:hypothetical protein
MRLRRRIAVAIAVVSAIRTSPSAIATTSRVGRPGGGRRKRLTSPNTYCCSRRSSISTPVGTWRASSTS